MDTLRLKPEGWKSEVTRCDINSIEEYIDSKKIFQGIVKECDENLNLHVTFGDNLLGIMPRTEVEGINLEEDGLPKVNLCKGKVHKFVQFNIKGLDELNNLILSRKNVQNDTISWVKNELKVGEKLNGIVKSIKPYGVFVEVAGGVVGLLHIEDISVARIKSPEERFKIGQNIDVVVKLVNKDKGKIILSYKEMFGTWEENIEKYQRGSNAKGIVREHEKNKNGIFIELEPNLVGMAEYQEGLNYGEVVDVYIKKIDSERKKVKLLIINK